SNCSWFRFLSVICELTIGRVTTPRLSKTSLSAESESDRHVVYVAIISRKDAVISRFREELSAPLTAERNTRSHVYSRLIHGVRADDHVRSERNLVKAEEWAESRADSNTGLRKVLIYPIVAAASSQVDIYFASRDEMHNRI